MSQVRHPLWMLPVRNELADHLNQKARYKREPMVPPAELASVAASLDDLKQILSDVGIPKVHR